MNKFNKYSVKMGRSQSKNDYANLKLQYCKIQICADLNLSLISDIMASVKNGLF